MNAPPLAQIEDVAVTTLAPAGYSSFVIRESVDEPGKLARFRPTLPPAMTACAISARPGNRRYGYPFTNCTNCGPRYTITRKIPYDRPLTTMACFPMCERCLREYEDPADRRFHAQPNACPDCGPSLALVSREQSEAPLDFSLAVLRSSARRGASCAKAAILAIKGLGGFHLACDPLNDAAVRAAARAKKAQRQTVRADGSRCRRGRALLLRFRSRPRRARKPPAAHRDSAAPAGCPASRRNSRPATTRSA